MNILFKLWFDNCLPQNPLWRKICIAIYLIAIPALGFTLYKDSETGLLILSALMLMWIIIVTSTIQMICTPASLQLVPQYKIILSIGVYVPLVIASTFFHIIIVYFFNESKSINLVPWMGLIWFVIAHFILTLSWSLRSNYPSFIYIATITFCIAYSWFKKEFIFEFLNVIPQWLFYVAGAASTLWLSFTLFNLNEKQAFSLQEKNTKMIASIKDGGSPQDVNTIIYRFSTMPYFSLMNKAIKKHAYSPSLLKFSLHPYVFFKVQLFQFYSLALLLLSMIFLGLFYFGNFPVLISFSIVFWSFITLTFFFCLLYPMSFHNLLFKTKNEQGLMCLCPHIGSNEALTKNIFYFFLRQNLILFFINLGLIYAGLCVVETSSLLKNLVLLLFFSLILLNVQIVTDLSFMNKAIVIKRLISIVTYSFLLLIFLSMLLGDVKINFIFLYVLIAVATASIFYAKWVMLFRKKHIFPIGRSV